MAKSKPDEVKKPTSPVENEVTESADAGESDVDTSPEVRRAATAVEKAKAELRKAQELYGEVRTETTARLKAVREKRVGELIDDGLNLVRKYPGPGVLLAALAGFFLGRLFRR